MADWRSKLARGLFPVKNRLIGALKKNYCQQDLSQWKLGLYRHAIWKAALKAAAYLSSAETVPYSKKTRLLTVPTSLEKESREHVFNIVMERNKGKVLPYDHPLSVRVRSVKNRLIEALERDLRGDKVWPVWGGFLNRNRESYLDHIQEWETVVVDDPDKFNSKFIGGTIVVYTGIVNNRAPDAVFAFLVAHEIGHGIARHFADYICLVSSLIRRRDSFWSLEPKEIKEHPSYLSLLKEMEFEADYIGLLLMASAGYDPSIGLKLLETLAKLGFKAYPSHPSFKRRAELAAQAQEEAMTFYKDSKVHYIKHQEI